MGATIFDVAKWFLSKEPMTPKKVQKLCYYYKAWGWALYDEELLPGYDFQAWVHGPVCPELYKEYREYGWNDIEKYNGELYPFNERETDILESVWITYGGMSANALEIRTHKEEPWIAARDGMDEFQNSEAVIDTKVMRSFYRKLYEKSQGD